MHHALPRLSHLALARAALDRRGPRRSDPDLLAGLARQSATRVLDLRGGRAPVVETDSGAALRLRAPRPEDAEGLAIYLGDDDAGDPYVAVVADDDPSDGASDPTGEHAGRGVSWADLRQVGVQLDDRDAGLFTTALALANWHATHGHCPRCGAATTPAQAGWIRSCAQDGSEHYPRTDPAVIMSVVDGRDRLLLARSPRWKQRRYSVLAGFVEPGETLAAAVWREVGEEVGVAVTDVTYLGDQPWPFPSSLMVGFTARATSDVLTLQEEEIAEARWVTRDELTAALAAGDWGIAGRLSIARRLIEHWYGREIEGVP